MSIYYTLELICIIAFALSGVLVDSNRGKDLISVMVLGWLTALGGGTARDVILNEQVFWIRDQSYFWAALASSLGGFFFINHIRKSKIEKLILLFDTIGVALFSILVTERLISGGYAPYIAVSMGTVTAIFGGVLRDIVAHRPTMFNNTEFYATPIIMGCCLYIVLNRFEVTDYIASPLCMLLIIIFRLFVVVKDIKFPRWLLLR